MEVDNVASGAEGFTSNAFLVGGEVLVDAGSDPVVLERLKGRELDKVVITHSHHDHVENLPDIVEEHSPELYAYEPGNLAVEARRLEDGREMELAGHVFKVLHTPGHRDDHVCLYCAEEKVLFSGDLLFSGGGFGRTDLEQGDRDVLIQSIEKVAELDVEVMYPGHGDSAAEDANMQIEGSLKEARKREPKY